MAETATFTLAWCAGIAYLVPINPNRIGKLMRLAAFRLGHSMTIPRDVAAGRRLSIARTQAAAAARVAPSRTLVSVAEHPVIRGGRRVARAQSDPCQSRPVD